MQKVINSNTGYQETYYLCDCSEFFHSLHSELVCVIYIQVLHTIYSP